MKKWTALLKAAASATDEAERGDLYRQIGELYAEEVPTMPLFWEPEFITNRAVLKASPLARPSNSTTSR